MLQQRRGRPMQHNHKVEVSNLQVGFSPKKRNDYNADICYMKIVEKEGKKKMRPITVLADEEILMPYWVSDKQDVILKVRDTFILTIEPLQVGRAYSIDAEFESLCIEREDQEPIKRIFYESSFNEILCY